LWLYGLASRPSEMRPAEYQLFVKAQLLLDDRSSPRVREAVALLEQTVQAEPRSAEAWAALANAYGVIAANDYDDPQVYGPKARAAVDRALRLAPGMAEAHAASGLVKTFYEWDWAGADAEYQKAISSKPSLTEAHLGWALSLVIRRRYDEAIAEARRAADLAPTSFAAGRALAMTYLYSGKPRESLAECHRLLRVNPQPWWIHGFMASVYKAMRDEAGYRHELQQASALPELSGAEADVLTELEHGQDADGRRDLDGLIAESKRRYVSPLRIASLYGAVGDWPRRTEWLEIAYQRRDCGLVWLTVSPIDAPPVQSVLARMGLLANMRH